MATFVLVHGGFHGGWCYRTFVLCERFRSINHATDARVRNLPGWKAVSLDRGHDVMVDDPDALAALLLEELGPHG